MIKKGNEQTIKASLACAVEWKAVLTEAASYASGEKLPIAILTGGLPCIGKSTLIRNNWDWMTNFAIFKIDAEGADKAT